MLPFASRYKLRLVIFNQREYPGSSSWNPEDLKRFSSEDFKERFTAVRNIGAELATFMARFIMTHNIPKITQKDGQRHGGAVLLSWSLGCASSFSFLANAATYPEEVRTCLEQYLRTVVLLGMWSVVVCGGVTKTYFVHQTRLSVCSEFPHLQIYIRLYVTRSIRWKRKPRSSGRGFPLTEAQSKIPRRSLSLSSTNVTETVMRPTLSYHHGVRE